MFPNLKVVLRDLGNILIVFSVLVLLLMIVAVIFQEFFVLKSVFYVASFSFLLGFSFRYAFRGAKETELKHAMVCAALAWLVIPAISAYLFVSVERFSILDAFFEAMSGWTGTGLTMAHPSELTRTMQFWRSFMQWVGGVGVIVLMVSVLGRRPGTGAFYLYKAEAREEKIKPSVISTVRAIWWIYLIFTAIGIILFKFAGMRAWEAINHAMTAIGTGGFTVTEESIAYYHNPWVEVAIIPIMMAGAISFIVHYKAMHGDLKDYVKDIQSRTFLILLFLLLIPLVAVNYFFFYGDILTSLRFSAFQLISGITCTGFQTADVHAWSGAAKMLVAIAMIFGGCAGSTAGGIKVLRVFIAYKGISDAVRKAFLPKRAVLPHKLGEQVLDDKEMNRVVSATTMLILLWIIFIFVGVAVLSYVVPREYSITDIIFEVCSAQGNVGLSTGITNKWLHPAGKIILIINMWIGRLEIIPVLMLFRSVFKGFKP